MAWRHWLKDQFARRTKPAHSTIAVHVPTMPIPVVLYTRSGCHLCDEAKAVLQKYQARFHLQIHEVDVDCDAVLRARYGESVPVVTIHGLERFRGQVNDVLLLRTLKSAK
jgi:glutaredoxin